MITGFILAHIGLLLIVLGFIMPRYYDVFIPPHRRDEGKEMTVANEPKGEVLARLQLDVEGGEAGLESSEDEKKRDEESSEQGTRSV